MAIFPNTALYFAGIVKMREKLREATITHPQGFSLKLLPPGANNTEH